MKNEHITHLEDLVLTGVDGTREAINTLRGISDSKIGMSTKYDGSPSIFAGVDPSDGRFFVAKKSIFNKKPKVYKTFQDIDNDTTGDLNDKMKIALTEFPYLGIKNIMQGDLLYAKENISEIEIQGKTYLSFHPNTIVYAILKDSPDGERISQSNLGVVWHTEYRGQDLSRLSGTFGTKQTQEVRSVWSIGSEYQTINAPDIRGNLSDIGRIFQKLEPMFMNELSYNKERFKRINIFINDSVRYGKDIEIDKLKEYVIQYFENEINKRKTERGKNTWRSQLKDSIQYFDNTSSKDLHNYFEMYSLMRNYKNQIIYKLNKQSKMKTFLKTRNGLEETGHEGYVTMNSPYVKLVNRREFSHANFSKEYLKGWERHK